jgi:hypothetical protein
MALKVNFLDNSTQYYASDMVKQFSSLMQMNGVPFETDLFVSETIPTSLEVKISSGSAWIDGYFITMDEDITLPIPLNSNSSDMINNIYLVLDVSNKSADIMIDSGNSEAGKLKLKLASVKMTNTNTVVGDSQISNRPPVVAHVSYDEFNELWNVVAQIINGGETIQESVESQYSNISAKTNTVAISQTSGATSYVKFMYVTQTQYNSLTPDYNTIYFIV